MARLHALNTDIKIQESEIAEACWMPLEELLQLPYYKGLYVSYMYLGSLLSETDTRTRCEHNHTQTRTQPHTRKHKSTCTHARARTHTSTRIWCLCECACVSVCRLSVFGCVVIVYFLISSDTNPSWISAHRVWKAHTMALLQRNFPAVLLDRRIPCTLHPLLLFNYQSFFHIS